MPLIEVTETPVDLEQQIADGLVAFTNQVNDEIVRLYRMGREMLWNRPDFTIKNVQGVIDKWGPVNAAKIFQASAALGQLIAVTNPGVLSEEELVSPVPYTLDKGRIVLDPKAAYPGVNNDRNS